jgi:hypothetical protein
MTERNKRMSLFMDVHNIEGGVSAADAAGAHEADLATQGEYGVSYLRYWVDEEAGKIFCLVDAPDAETANTVHRPRRRDEPARREPPGPADPAVPDGRR